MDIKWVSDRFQNFAELECEGSSDLYKTLSLQIAKDSELLKLCLCAREEQPIPNLLFGAVHYLLLQGTNHKLKDFYPSVGNGGDRADNPFPFFKDFCMKNSPKIKDLLKNKRVQTNEVRRCAYLYPVFCYIYQQTNMPLSLIEIGTSAGLQLLWDHYSYSYGGEFIYGKKDSSVLLTSNIRKGEVPHHLLSLSPPVHDRIGLDLKVSDLTSEEDYLWLKALIWPEHTKRRTNFEGAASELKQNPPPLIEGDGVRMLPQVVKDIPMDTTICIFHTHVANQMPNKVKDELLHQVHKIGNTRDVFHIYNNMYDTMLHIDAIRNGEVHRKIVGETDGHARWFDWNVNANILP